MQHDEIGGKKDMAKKLLIVWLSMTIVFFSSISIYAEDNVTGEFFLRNIVINGETIENYQLDNPFFSYKNSTYVPLTEEVGNIMGFQATMDWESRTLKLLKTDSKQKNVSQRWMKSNQKDLSVKAYQDIQIIAYEATTVELTQTDREMPELIEPDSSMVETTPAETTPEGTLEATQEAAKEIVSAPVLSAQQVDLRQLPVLVKDDVVYMPISAMTSQKIFGWDAYFEPYSGLYLSTVPGTEAKTYFEEKVSRYNKGLVNYVIKYNKSITTTAAQEMVFLFQTEAKIHKVDPMLLMAIAHKESTFNAGSVSRAGATGLMQIMPATAKIYGVSKSQLKDVHTSIELGAITMSERIDNYKGNVVLALTSYNQGSGAVSRGSYTTRYASKILDTQGRIQSYLDANGYGTAQ